MSNRKASPKTARTVQEIFNRSFDDTYEVVAVELLAEDAASNATSRLQTDTSGNLKVNIVSGGTGGGAVTVADGDDVAEGATTDAAVAAGAAGTVSAKLRRLTTDVDAIKTSVASLNTKTTAVDTGAVTVASSALPSGAATAANQSTANTSLSNINTKLATAKTADYDSGAGTDTVQMTGIALPASGGAVAGGTSTNPLRTDPTGTTTQPVSAASLPLPSGAATSALQSTGNTSVASIDTNTGAIADSVVAAGATGSVSAKLRRLTTDLDAVKTSVASLDTKTTASNTGAVVVSSSALPSGAATSALQTTGNTSVGNIDTNTGAIADAAVAAGATGSINAKLRRLTTDLDAVKTSVASLDTKTTAANTGAVVVSSSALPALAATSTKQSDGTQKTQIVDGSGNVIGSTSNALDINIKSGSAVSDATASGSLTGTGSVTATGIVGVGTAAIQVTGTWVGTLIFEGSVDGTNFFTVNAQPIAGTTTVTTATANGQWQCDTAGFTSFRVRCSAYTSGTITITIRVSAASDDLAYALLRDGSGNAIASATTTPGASDRGIVVRNLPSGTQTISGSVTVSSGSITASGTVTANQGTANATPWNSNTSQIGGTTVATGNGVVGAGVQRVAIASDNTAFSVNLTAGTNTNEVVGDAAHGAAVSGNPLLNGLEARTTNGTAVTDGQVVRQRGDKLGRTVVAIGQVRDLVTTATTTITSTTETTILAAGAAGVFHDITAITLANTSATAVRVDIRDATLGSVVKSFYLPAGDERGISFTRPWKQTTAANNWTAQLSSGVTDVRIFVQAEKNL